ncbi:MAG: hypothetical protein QXS90_03020, partial [Candidatus Diapherotrites archaeon]
FSTKTKETKFSVDFNVYKISEELKDYLYEVKEKLNKKAIFICTSEALSSMLFNLKSVEVDVDLEYAVIRDRETKGRLGITLSEFELKSKKTYIPIEIHDRFKIDNKKMTTDEVEDFFGINIWTDIEKVLSEIEPKEKRKSVIENIVDFYKNKNIDSAVVNYIVSRKMLQFNNTRKTEKSISVKSDEEKELNLSFLYMGDLGISCLIADEAHEYKNGFSFDKKAIGVVKANSTASYGDSGGGASQRANTFTRIVNNIFFNNENTKIVLLTATPFTNKEVEVYHMLSLCNPDMMIKLGYEKPNVFFDTFFQYKNAIRINIKNEIVYETVMKQFRNLGILRGLINNCVNYKSGEQIKIQRPNKINLPYRHKEIFDSENKTIKREPLPKSDQKDTLIKPSFLQKLLYDLNNIFLVGLSKTKTNKEKEGVDSVITEAMIEILKSICTGETQKRLFSEFTFEIPKQNIAMGYNLSELKPLNKEDEKLYTASLEIQKRLREMLNIFDIKKKIDKNGNETFVIKQLSEYENLEAEYTEDLIAEKHKEAVAIENKINFL